MGLMMNASQSLGLLPPRRPAGGSLRGAPLPDDIRRAAEELFGTDLSDVRVYVGPEAQRLRALAFTVGRHVYFAPGHYDPTTQEGVWLIGHELAHVVQQKSGRVHNRFGYGVAVVRDEALEDEADRLGAKLAAQLSSKGKKKENQAELNAAEVVNRYGFNVMPAGAGKANADIFADNGSWIWIVEVKGTKQLWLSKDSFDKKASTPAKQLGNKVKDNQGKKLVGRTQFSIDDAPHKVTLANYIAYGTDGYESLLLGVTNLDTLTALLAFEVSVHEEDTDDRGMPKAIVEGFHPMLLQRALNFIKESPEKALSGDGELLQDSWNAYSGDNGDFPNIRVWMQKDLKGEAVANVLSSAYTERRREEAQQIGNIATLAKIDKNKEIRLVPVIKFIEQFLPPVPSDEDE